MQNRQHLLISRFLEKTVYRFFKSMHKCNRNGSNTLSLWPFYHFAPNCEIDLQTTCTNMFQMPPLRIKDDILAKLF